MDSDDSGASQGPATDRHNEPVIDPTENVKALSAAANDRQDDLRTLESEHLREILALRTEHVREIRASDSALTNERFASVQREQAMTESHRIELKGDSEKALTAALSAQKEAAAEQNKSNTLAIDKAVSGMKELIVNNAQVSQATTDALSDKVEDLKTSVSVIVNTQLGAREQKTEVRGGSANIYGLIGTLVGVLSLIIAAVAVVIATR